MLYTEKYTLLAKIIDLFARLFVYFMFQKLRYQRRIPLPQSTFYTSLCRLVYRNLVLVQIQIQIRIKRCK